MDTVTLFRSPSFEVLSHGNGWAYTIRNKQTGESKFFQDDAAQDLQNTVNAYENHKPEMPYDEIYQVIWDEYDTLEGRQA